MRIAAIGLIVVTSAAVASGCHGGSPTEPAEVSGTPLSAVGPAAPPAPVPAAPAPLTQLTMTGFVYDDEGRPIPNAILTRWFGFYEQQTVSTDAAGKYRLQFTAARGSEPGPGAAQDAVAFVTAEAPAYQYMSHYALAPTDEFVVNFRMHRIQTIAAGGFAQVSIAPDDSVCGWDWWPGRETICRWLHVSVPTDGTLTVEVVPVGAPSRIAWVEAWTKVGGAHGNPAVLTVSAGSDVTVAVAVDWGATSIQSFLIESSLASK